MLQLNPITHLSIQNCSSAVHLINHSLGYTPTSAPPILHGLTNSRVIKSNNHSAGFVLKIAGGSSSQQGEIELSALALAEGHWDRLDRP